MSIRNQNFGVERVGGTGIGSKNGQGIYRVFDRQVPHRPKVGACRRQGVSLRQHRCRSCGRFVGVAGCFCYLAAETDNIVIAAANGFDPAAGSTQFQITLASITADQYAGALLQITDDAGEGIQYRIKSNSATDATTSGKVDIYLFDPIKVALTTRLTSLLSATYGTTSSALRLARIISSPVSRRLRSPVATTVGFRPLA